MAVLTTSAGDSSTQVTRGIHGPREADWATLANQLSSPQKKAGQTS